MQDPEGILAAPKGGHIARRSLQKQVMEDKELAKQVEAERERARAELQKLRDVSAAGPLNICLGSMHTKRFGIGSQQTQMPTWGNGGRCVLRRRVKSPEPIQKQCSTF